MIERALRKRILSGVLIALCLTLALATFVNSLTLAPSIFDDGTQLTGAMLWLRGQTPNVDFYSVYPPLNYYIIGTAFRVFGESIVAYRIVQTMAYVVTVAAVAWLAWCRTRGAWLTPALFVLLLLGISLDELQAATALMFSMLAVILTLEGRGKSGASRSVCLAAAGGCLGALALTRLNFALYFAFALLIDHLAFLTYGEFRAKKRSILNDLASVGLPAVAVATAVLLLWGGSLSSLAHQIVVAPSRALATYSFAPVPSTLVPSAILLSLEEALAAGLPTAWLAVRSAEEGDRTASRLLWALTLAISISWICFGRWRPLLLPLLAAVLVIAVIVAGRRLRRLPPDERFVLFLLSAQEHYVLVRPDGMHFVALFPLLSVLFVIGVSAESGRLRARLAALVVATCAGMSALVTKSTAHRLVTHTAALGGLPSLLRTNDEALYGECGHACDVFRPDPDEFAAVSFLRGRAPQNEPVYSGFLYNQSADDHDVRAYWLLRRPAGAHQIMMMRGLGTNPDQESEIVRDLQSRRVRWLFLVANKSRYTPSDGAGSIVDDYIQTHYSREARFGAYEIWQANI